MSKKVIGIWVRVSSTMQVDRDSHVHHEMRAKAFVKSRDWTIGKIYRLEALSGKSIMGYEETKRMLNDVKTGAISGLVFSKIARLARNTKELIEIAQLFQEHSADLISMDMSIDTSTSIGRHFFRQMASMAEWEREMISERISASIITRAELGKHLGGQPPYGFQYVDKKLQPHPDEAPVLKLMYELFLEHKRKKTVANILNEKGYRTKRGNKFTDSTVKRLLKNTVAKGIHIMNTRYSSSAKPNQYKPKEEWVFHEVEPVVSEELWESVNRIIESQQRSHKQVLNTKVHLFTGFIFCECGSRMYTRYNSENYVCHSSCGNLIRKDDIEEIFRNELHSYTVSEDRVNSYFKRLKVILKDRQKQLQKLRREKDKLDKQIESILLLHSEGKIATEAFHTYHQKPYVQLQQVEASISELERDISFDSVAEKSTNEVLDLARNLFEKWEHLTHEQKREVIETITEKIIIGKDEIDINLYKILPDSESHPFLESQTNGQHTLNGMLPICNVRIHAEKPEYRPFPEETDKSLGACLKRRRLELEWTQRDCANHFGVLKDSYQKWEWNQITPVIYRQKMICEFLGFNYWDDGTETLANRLRLYRIEMKLTQTELAKLFDVGVHTIERIEGNKGLVSKEVRNKISDFMEKLTM